MRNPYRQLEAALGYRFRRRRHIETALTHRSYRFENDELDTDNQRLEFLGDAVLGLIAADHLFQEFHEGQEGHLTKLRSCLANSDTLAEIAARIKLGDYLRLGRGEQLSGGAARPSNICDCLEAVIGAAYLDGGLKAARKIFHKLFLAEFENIIRDDFWLSNPKGALQELSQHRWKTGPHYRTVREDGPAHSKTFTIEVVVNGRVCGSGSGASKRTAEAAAAQNALNAILADDKG